MTRAFARAYDYSKRQIVSGVLRPGQHIDIKYLSGASKVSTSPMREALCTLAGEGLLEVNKGSGFNVPAFDFGAIADLLNWSDHLAALCAKSVSGKRGRRPSGSPDRADHITRVIQLFETVGAVSGNREASHALMNATLRLNALYRLESRLLPDTADELAGLEGALENLSPRLPSLLHSFHRRRVAALPKMARLGRDLLGDDIE